MASSTDAFIFLLFSLILNTTTSAVTTTVSPPPQLQLNSIIDAIIGAGDFNNWANLLGQADPSIIPITVTFFIPNDDAFLNSTNTSSSINFGDPLVLTYHIIPRRFSFSDLRKFSTGSRLPTLLPGKTLLITNNSVANFTINNASITHPDLFQNAVVSVHGVSSVLDYTLFGNSDHNSSSSSSSFSSSPFSSLSPIPVQEQQPSADQQQQQQPSSVTSQVMWKSVANSNNVERPLHLQLIVCLAIICVPLELVSDLGMYFVFAFIIASILCLH